MRSLNLLAVCLPVLVGCARYQVGAGSLYAPDIATVYVPMIESDSYRRDLGERLTEAVVKEIELKTPYKVVGTPDADSILSVHLLGDSRRTIVENGFDDPRLSEVAMYSEVSWLNRRRQPIAPVQTLGLPPELVRIDQTSNLIPEVGQSVAVSEQQAIERLAEQIVGTMEAPW
jgi:Lipopolysaccharide-assembly